MGRFVYAMNVSLPQVVQEYGEIWTGKPQVRVTRGALRDESEAA